MPETLTPYELAVIWKLTEALKAYHQLPGEPSAFESCPFIAGIRSLQNIVAARSVRREHASSFDAASIDD